MGSGRKNSSGGRNTLAGTTSPSRRIISKVALRKATTNTVKKKNKREIAIGSVYEKNSSLNIVEEE